MAPSETSATLMKRHNSKSADDEKETTTVADEKPKTTPPKKAQPPFKLISLLGGVGGMIDFSLFKAPGWVDTSLPPGTTSQLESYLENPKIWTIVSGYYIIFSPNLVWFTIAALIYVLAPYDMELARQGWSWEWYRSRAAMNVVIMFIYYGFWHVMLYGGLGFAKRPFAQGRVYRWSKTVHNAWYCVLGVLQWTAWEMIMVHLYATGRIGYQRDEEIFSSPKEFAKFFGAAIFVPVFRECQFFFAHRFIHLRCLYKYIHALHHRNSDVEPFSGLCMTPAEHLYYISSIAPSVYWHASPFQFLWNGIHLVLSPGASHSGWEDHWHSDQYHAAHHRYFECNYGTPGLPLDRWFGTFRETMAPQTKSYKGEAVECVSQEGSAVITARADSKSTLLGLPSWDQMLYYAATAVGLPLFTMYATMHRDTVPAPLAAFVVSIGPLVLAATLSAVTANPPIASWEKFRYAMLYPQHNEPLLGLFSVGLVCGFVLSIMPTFHFFHSLFVSDVNDTAYNQIWGAVN